MTPTILPYSMSDAANKRCAICVKRKGAHIPETGTCETEATNDVEPKALAAGYEGFGLHYIESPTIQQNLIQIDEGTSSHEVVW